jgi:hypothetical protein
MAKAGGIDLGTTDPVAAAVGRPTMISNVAERFQVRAVPTLTQLRDRRGAAPAGYRATGWMTCRGTIHDRR